MPVCFVAFLVGVAVPLAAYALLVTVAMRRAAVCRCDCPECGGGCA